ncbi:MAG: hypothetical protein ACYC64_11950 [Armatimonadota bacterium]
MAHLSICFVGVAPKPPRVNVSIRGIRPQSIEVYYKKTAGSDGVKRVSHRFKNLQRSLHVALGIFHPGNVLLFTFRDEFADQDFLPIAKPVGAKIMQEVIRKALHTTPQY